MFGVSLTGMTDYMFNPNTSLFLRGLSLFHGWLPFMLVYLVWKLGYDRRGAAGLDRPRLGVAAGLLLPDAAAAARSGPDAGEHQLRVGHERSCGADLGSPYVWLAGLMIVLPVIFLLTHFLLARFAPKAPA